MVRALDSHSRGHWFKSSQVHLGLSSSSSTRKLSTDKDIDEVIQILYNESRGENVEKVVELEPKTEAKKEVSEAKKHEDKDRKYPDKELLRIAEMFDWYEIN